MARPLSEEKRNLILQAAIQLFAEEGLNAPTSKIAKLAGVAEGTLFTYFTNKDELLNQLYIDLKRHLHKSILNFFEQPDLYHKLAYAWMRYVNWGEMHPNEHKVLAMLSLSSKITEQNHKTANEMFCQVIELLAEAKATGPLKDQSTEFVGALMGAMANTTIEFIKMNPSDAVELTLSGSKAFWNAVTKT